MSITLEGLTEEQREVVSLVRQFTDEQIIPVASDLERDDIFPDQIVAGLKELGLFGFTIPEQYGGLGLDLTTYALSVCELARGWMSVSGIINTHFIVADMLMRDGTEEQKARFLPRMATGEVRCAFSMTEPECGSDVQAIRARAVRDGDDYVVNGQKMWVTNGLRSGVRAARTRRPGGRRLWGERSEDVGAERAALWGGRPPREDRPRRRPAAQGDEL